MPAIFGPWKIRVTLGGVLLNPGDVPGLGFLSVGIRLGSRFHFDAMIGSVVGTKYLSGGSGPYSTGERIPKSGFGVVGELGYYIPLGGWWWLHPSILVAKATDLDGVGIYGVIGPSLYARKRNEE